MVRITRNSSAKEVVIATLYAEARDQYNYRSNGANGIEWVLWVIINRARQNKNYWGGDELKRVCLQSNNGNYQFECWQREPNGINISDRSSYDRCTSIFENLLDKLQTSRDWTRLDPTNFCDHYNNPNKEGYPSWTNNCHFKEKVGDHQFYQSRLIDGVRQYFFLYGRKIEPVIERNADNDDRLDPMWQAYVDNDFPF